MPIIPLNTAASGLDIKLRDGAGQLTDPTVITYDIQEPGLTLVADDIAGFKRAVGHYDARNTVIPSGFDVSKPWKVIWSWTAADGVSSSATEEFTVSTGLGGSFTDLDNITKQIKEDIAATAGEFTEEQLEIFIVKSLDRLNLKLQLQGTTDELSFNDSLGVIQPTPSSPMRALIVMQAECLIVKRRQSSAISKGIKVRDGDSAIDTTAGFAGHKDIVTDICETLDKCIAAFLRGLSGVEDLGAIIWHGNSRLFEDADFDGDAFGTKDFRTPFDSKHLGPLH